MAMNSIRDWFFAMSPQQRLQACQTLRHIALACLGSIAGRPGPGPARPDSAWASDLVSVVIVKNFERSATTAPVALLADAVEQHIRTLQQRREHGEIRLVCQDGGLVEVVERSLAPVPNERPPADRQAVFGHVLKLTALEGEADGPTILADMIDGVPPKVTIARGIASREVYRLRRQILSRTRTLLRALDEDQEPANDP
jgi:hypothetical protein